MTSYNGWRCRWGCLFVSLGLLVVGMGCGRGQQVPADRTRSGISQPAAPPGVSGGWLDEAPVVGSTVPSKGNGSAIKPPREAQVIPETNDVVIGTGFGIKESPDKVILEPGDEIEAKFYYTPILDVNQVIRPDGYISMQLVGEVMAAGKTPAELGSELTTLYGWNLKNPQISIIVRSLRNRCVYIGGCVMRPGIVQMPGPMTLMEAVVDVGGFDRNEAKLKNIIVIRNEGGKRKVFKVDMRQAMKGIDVEPFSLRPKDIVYVPQTAIAQADQWVDQYLNKLIPKFVYITWFPFGYPYR